MRHFSGKVDVRRHNKRRENVKRMGKVRSRREVLDYKYEVGECVVLGNDRMRKSTDQYMFYIKLGRR